MAERGPVESGTLLTASHEVSENVGDGFKLFEMVSKEQLCQVLTTQQPVSIIVSRAEQPLQIIVIKATSQIKTGCDKLCPRNGAVPTHVHEVGDIACMFPFESHGCKANAQ